MKGEGSKLQKLVDGEYLTIAEWSTIEGFKLNAPPPVADIGRFSVSLDMANLHKPGMRVRAVDKGHIVGVGIVDTVSDDGLIVCRRCTSEERQAILDEFEQEKGKGKS